MKYLEFCKSVSAGKLGHAYFFAGEEGGLIDEGVDALLAKLVNEDDRDFNFDLFYGSEIAASKLIEVARSYPMMASHRTVLVRDIHEMSPGDLEAVVDYIKKPNSTTYLIMTQRGKSSRKKALESLKRLCVYVDCRPLYDNQVVPWIMDYVRQLNIAIAPNAAQFLATEVGNSVQALRSELDKVRLFIRDEQQITLTHVQQVAGSRREYSVFSLQDAFGERRLDQALKIIANLPTTTSVGAIVSSLTRYFANLYTAQALPRKQDAAQLSKRTGVHTFFVDKLHAGAKSYSPTALFNAFEVLQHVDYVAKSQSISRNIILRIMTLAIIKGFPPEYLPYSVDEDAELFAS